MDTSKALNLDKKHITLTVSLFPIISLTVACNTQAAEKTATGEAVMKTPNNSSAQAAFPEQNLCSWNAAGAVEPGAVTE